MTSGDLARDIVEHLRSRDNQIEDFDAVAAAWKRCVAELASSAPRAALARRLGAVADEEELKVSWQKLEQELLWLPERALRDLSASIGARRSMRRRFCCCARPAGDMPVSSMTGATLPGAAEIV